MPRTHERKDCAGRRNRGGAGFRECGEKKLRGRNCRLESIRDSVANPRAAFPESLRMSRIVYEDRYFQVVAPAAPLNCRDDGGHLVLIKREAVTDRSDLSFEEAIDFMRISMAVGKAMYQVLGIERMNYEDLGNWGLDEPGGAKLHLHFFGAREDAGASGAGAAHVPLPKGHPIYDGHLKPIGDDEGRDAARGGCGNPARTEISADGGTGGALGRAAQALHDGAVDFDERLHRRARARHLLGVFRHPQRQRHDGGAHFLGQLVAVVHAVGRERAPELAVPVDRLGQRAAGDTSLARRSTRP